MLKHFCDLCGKELLLTEKSYEIIIEPRTTLIGHHLNKELCEECMEKIRDMFNKPKDK